MGAHNKLEELRKKKLALQAEVKEMESHLTLDIAKESLSEFTNGFSDKFLKDTVDHHGQRSVSLKTDAIIKEVALEVKERILGKNALFSLANTATQNGLLEEAVKLGITAMVGNFAQKNLKNSNWKKKAIGLAMVYIAPMVIRFAINKADEYRKNKSISSFEQLI